jgi:hypothetical protein
MEQAQFEGITPTSVRREQEEIKEAIEVSRCVPLPPPSFRADRDRVKMSKVESKMNFEYEQEKGPFCCSGTGQGRMKHGTYIHWFSFPVFKCSKIADLEICRLESFRGMDSR